MSQENGLNINSALALVDSLIPNSGFNSQKIIADLNQGFRFQHVDNFRHDNSVLVAANLGPDIFVVRLDSTRLLPESADSFLFFFDRLDVRRRRQLFGPGSRTLERWDLVNSHTTRRLEPHYVIQTARGGSLSENDFWDKYNSSHVNPDLTQQLFENTQTEAKKTHGRQEDILLFTWLSQK
ncbi:MAG TPA: hypothetical protein VF828_01355 [Patescibacteria group bacterium]